MIVHAWGAATDRGRVRLVNEDCLLADPPVFLIADGMGGQAAGDVASRLAVDQFEPLVGQSIISVDQTVATVLDANQAIIESARDHPDTAGMGTTVTGLAVVNAAGAEHWLVFNVGDSRVYQMVDGRLIQLTVDHSEVEDLVASGRLTAEEARVYPGRNILTRSLGTDPPPVPDSWVFPPLAGERFVICSDGLTNELSDAEIAACASSFVHPQDAADELVVRALASGGRDNVTVIIVDGPRLTESSAPDEDTSPRGNHGERG